ncbi:MAG: NAD(P)-dependent oxidoreductase [Acidimicrobiia bacterium]|nr:NAD(P)-dependent oxidoreductase [Acidimicrobiia bacterium]
MQPISVVGLGIMGSRLASRLLGAGHHVRGFDIDERRMADFAADGGHPATSPADAATGCEIVVLSLLTSQIAREVCLGESGLSSVDSRPMLVLDSTTGDPEDSISIARELANSGIDYADMTISGNAAVADRGELVVMFGGSDEAFRRAAPVMDAIGRSAHHVGPVGAGARTKLIVNHVLAVNRTALAEGLVVAELSGLDPAATLEILRDSAARSGAMELWGDRMVTADHERPNARLRQSHKDARLMAGHARAFGAPTPALDVARSILEEGENTGLADKDNSSVIEVLRRRAGIGRIATTETEIE